MWRSRWRCVMKPAYSVSFVLSINVFVWQNVLYFLDAPRIIVLQKDQTGSEAHPSSHSMGTRDISRRQSGREHQVGNSAPPTAQPETRLLLRYAFKPVERNSTFYLANGLWGWMVEGPALGRRLWRSRSLGTCTVLQSPFSFNTERHYEQTVQSKYSHASQNEGDTFWEIRR